jgi:hypothetical protein
MTPVEAVVCPNCGAPLELLPDRTCRWCRSPIAEPSSLARSTLSDAEARALKAQAFDRVMRRWTLRPQGPWIDWDGPPDSPTTGLRPPYRDLIYVVRDGMGQPAVGELVAGDALDRQFCRLVAGAMTGGGMPKLCGVAMAIALDPRSDRGWADAATAVIDAAKHQLDAQGSWKHGQDYQAPISLREPTDADALRFPGLAALDAWVDSKFDAGGVKHKRWIKS